jgi:hypothetical protein
MCIINVGYEYYIIDVVSSQSVTSNESTNTTTTTTATTVLNEGQERVEGTMGDDGPPPTKKIKTNQLEC